MERVCVIASGGSSLATPFTNVGRLILEQSTSVDPDIL